MQSTTQPPDIGNTPYGQSAKDCELASLAQAGHGGRNVALNRAAYILGTLIAGGELHGRATELDLLAVAVDTLGLPSREAKTTIRATLKRSARSPRSAPGNDRVTPILGRSNRGGGTGHPGLDRATAVLEDDPTYAFEWTAAKSLATLSRAEERQQVISSWDFLSVRADVARLLATVQMIREVSKSQYGTPLARRLVRELEYV